ncbi:Zinc finger protein [Wickerhamomyces ciferrii]|uniref:Zinc finger protein n=1 Tax=Wickerhamomyces ciferrii (strain ATCC 14091 / BCRC 22168 / CBS 111 / JCM 3599 / NBRC 0793 / NRRL Y-1031 F-60-10) TaxID=1206466 RepID=K0KH05_WICCF|nr:Zinc finger protein [Wickerhamomyces ciferrii]CCH41467.1 Zinc finger protein [Wickerhamomyces ciferrii]
MSLYDQTWITPPSSTENKNTSYFMEYVKPEESSIPLPHEDFTPYQQNFDQVDDFLTQTLSSLQDLDIPVGQSSSSTSSYAFNQNQYGSDVSHGPVRGHKKQPSGTAIFGFANHNKTLSIPGMPQRPPSAEHPSISPEQLYSHPQQYQPHPQQQQQQQQPILYQKPQDLEAVNQKLLQQNRQLYQDHPQSLPQYPLQVSSNQYQQHIVPQPQHLKKNDDFIVTNKNPSSYKFPPEPPIPQHQQLYNSPSTQQNGSNGQKTVSVPVEYLQKITNYIKSRENIDMNKFLDSNYDYSDLQDGFNAKRSLSPNPPVDISPVLKQMEVQQQQQQQQQQEAPAPAPAPIEQTSTSNSTEINTPVYTPEEQKLPLSGPTPQPPQSQPQSQNTIGLGIRFEHNVKQDFESSSESEFLDAPKTPSPILKSQATFSSESKQNSELNWTPVIIGDHSLPMMKRKPQDKVSTLPPGEIDQYVIGPREDKTYVCNFKNCGKLFTRRYNVRSHVQTHLSDRPFLCDFEGCNKAFVRQHDLTRHKKIHEEFEHKCPCGKGFSRHDALYRHRIRMVCRGGIKGTDEEMALYASLNSNSAPSSSMKSKCNHNHSSVTKSKKKQNKPIKIENDKVAKKLEFDLLKDTKNSSSSASTPKLIKSEQPVAIDGSENVFIEEQNQIDSNQASINQHTPSPTDDSFLNDLNFGFDPQYEEFNEFVR